MSSNPLPLPFSGERYTPETPGEIAYEHWHRYYAALPLARDRRVLDAACGEGYGSALLADAAAEVIGVDLSTDAIAHARERYADRARLRFLNASVTDLTLPDASVDLVVSFETIEHLAEQAAMLAEFRRVLKPAGLLLISSPNKPAYTDERAFHNEFHVRELTREELAELLAPGFPRQRWFGQRLMFHSLIWPESASVTRVEMLAHDGERASPTSEPSTPMYFLVLCGGRAAELPEEDRLSLFADRDLAIYREFERTTRAERKLNALLQARERELDEQQHKLAAAYREFDDMHQRMRDLHANWQMLSRMVEERDSTLAALREQLANLQAQRARDEAQLATLLAQQAQSEARMASLQMTVAQQRAGLQEVSERLAYRETLPGWLGLPLAKLRRTLGR